MMDKVYEAPIKSCAYCGDIATTKDHIVPRSQGGKVVVDCCMRCNSAKANYSLEHFLFIIEKKEKQNSYGSLFNKILSRFSEYDCIVISKNIKKYFKEYIE